MVLRLKVRSGGSETILSAEDAALVAPGGGEIFTSLIEAPSRRWLSLACSVMLHGVMTAGVVYVFDHAPRASETLASRYTVRMIRFNNSGLPQPPAPSSQSVLPRPVAAEPAHRADASQPPDLSRNLAAALAQASPPSLTRRQFELPKLPVPARPGQILIQPDFPPDLALNRDLRVPELLIWKPRLPAPPPRKQFVAQKRAQEAARPKNLPAPPVLDSPNNETQLADMPFSARVSNPAPMLPRPPASTTPIRTGAGEIGAVPQIASSQSDSGDSPNILSIPDMPVPGAGVFPVPAGNQGAAANPGSGGGAGQGGGSAAAGSKVAGGTGNVSGSGVVSGGLGRSAGNGPVGGTGSGASAAGTGPGSGSPGHGSGKDTGEGGEGTGGSVLAAGRPVTKVVLPPDGHFTVLVQSSGSEPFPEAEGILTGKLVYTVYVKAGAAKEWILQYCLPRAIEQKSTTNGKTPPLEAPYPYLMLRPDISFGPDVDYLIVHGLVTAAGKFDQLTYVIAPPEQAEAGQLLHSLQQWQIRPGKLDGQPVMLEVLLIIPRDGD